MMYCGKDSIKPICIPCSASVKNDASSSSTSSSSDSLNFQPSKEYRLVISNTSDTNTTSNLPQGVETNFVLASTVDKTVSLEANITSSKDKPVRAAYTPRIPAFTHPACANTSAPMNASCI